MRAFAGLLIFCCLAALSWNTPRSVPAADGKPDRSAGDIVKEIEQLKLQEPEKPAKKDAKLVRSQAQKKRRVLTQRAKLILELYIADPSHQELDTLFPERWDTLSSSSTVSPATLAKELDEVAAHSKSEKLKPEVAYYKGVVAITSSKKGLSSVPADVEAFLKQYPDDSRGATLLYQTAKRMQVNSSFQKVTYDRVIKSFPESEIAGKLKEEQKAAVGDTRKFELAFVDATSGNEISAKTLRGKILVIDFWATWCGPCVAEMPHMKELYSKYHSQGVEFIGVSLDESEDKGGLSKLRTFVLEKEIPWPQFYQGNGWKSEFSSSWQISAIPALFVVAPDGTVISKQARGKLDEILPPLIEKQRQNRSKKGRSKA